MPPLAKFGVVALLAVPLCFALAYGLQKLLGAARGISAVWHGAVALSRCREAD
jgi:hypothetical protein